MEQQATQILTDHKRVLNKKAHAEEQLVLKDQTIMDMHGQLHTAEQKIALESRLRIEAEERAVQVAVNLEKSEIEKQNAETLLQRLQAEAQSRKETSSDKTVQVTPSTCENFVQTTSTTSTVCTQTSHCSSQAVSTQTNSVVRKNKTETQRTKTEANAPVTIFIPPQLSQAPPSSLRRSTRSTITPDRLTATTPGSLTNASATPSTQQIATETNEAVINRDHMASKLRSNRSGKSSGPKSVSNAFTERLKQRLSKAEMQLKSTKAERDEQRRNNYQLSRANKRLMAENAKLIGHKNSQQKIQHFQQVKEELNELKERESMYLNKIRKLELQSSKTDSLCKPARRAPLAALAPSANVITR